MSATALPAGQAIPLSAGEGFSFLCHPGVACFTECCRELDLLLTPYDCLRLKNHLGLHSGKLLEQYVIMEWDERLIFPQCYLTMVDDGRGSCVFVGEQGCKVYPDRPGACRAYPVGRGLSRQGGKGGNEHFVLLKEGHCLGFAEKERQDPAGYLEAQGMNDYNRFNDELAALVQHERILAGFRPDRSQLAQYILALYDLDSFRKQINNGILTLRRPFNAAELSALAGNDEELLLFGLRWLREEWFGE